MDMLTTIVPEPLSPSVIKILDGAIRAIGARGARRLSMSDVIEASGVSRGTLYKYFSDKDDVLSAVSEFVSINFENGVREAAAAHRDPIDRFRAVMLFYSAYTNEQSPARVLEFEPAFHLEFFRTHFTRHKAAVHDALAQTFDYLDSISGAVVDRHVVVESLVRMQLSTLIVPADSHWSAKWDAAAEDILSWIMTLAGIVPSELEK
jgi:AcrR family transcriptional regulator